MLVQKKELVKCLQMAMPGIESGSAVLQGADCFVFYDGKIFTYNDSISVTVPISSEGLLEEGVEGCVKADEFFKVVSKLPGDDIKFSVTEKNTWLLKCGEAKLEMNLLNFDYEARLKTISPKDDKWIDLTEDFISGMSVCRMSGNKTQVSGVYVEGSNVVSTDGNQINLYTFKGIKLPKFWISDSSVGELIKLNKLTAVQIQDTWVHFKAEDGTLFSIKTLQASVFPYEKIKSIMDTSDIKKAILHAKFPKEVFSAIDRAVSFSMEISEYSAVRLEMSKDKIVVSSERSTGKYNEKIAWEEQFEDDFEPFTVYVDAQKMQYMAQRTVEFYLLEGPVRNGKSLPRLLFVTDSSKHLLATLNATSNEE